MNRRDHSRANAGKVITVHFYMITRVATVVLKPSDYNHITKVVLFLVVA